MKLGGNKPVHVLFFITCTAMFLADYYVWSNWGYATFGTPYVQGTLLGIALAATLALFDVVPMTDRFHRAVAAAFGVVRLLVVVLAGYFIATLFVVSQRTLNLLFFITIGVVTLMLKWALGRYVFAGRSIGLSTATQPLPSTSDTRTRKQKLLALIEGKSHVLSLIRKELEEREKE